MPTPVTYSLAERDGEVFVAARLADWNEPRYVINHYPTPFGVRMLLRAFDDEPQSLADFTIVQTMPGEYCITHVCGRRVYGSHLTFCLPEGGRTQSAFTTFAPVPKPRAGKGTKLEWHDGAWHKYLPSGKHERVYV